LAAESTLRIAAAWTPHRRCRLPDLSLWEKLARIAPKAGSGLLAASAAPSVGDSSPASTEEWADAKKRSRRGDISIAIVDDEEEICHLFATLIKNLGYREELIAHDGAEIVRYVVDQGSHPDLIIMDYRMPLMNGMQAAEKILRAKPDIKIIITTADDSVKKEALAAGMRFLQKPFSLSVLAKAIEDALKDSGHRKETKP
jgi:CheY-like chemotaxis protein